MLGAALSPNTAVTSPGWRQFRVNRVLKEFLPLLINVVVTILTESTGFIHSVTLRWALGSRLTFNSNLWLFSIVPGSWAFGRISNFFGAAFLILSYAATSIIFSNVPASQVCAVLPLNGYNCDEKFNYDRVFFRPGSVIALGVGLLGLNASATWQFRAVKIATWSSSPIDTAGAAFVTGQRQRQEGRCMRAVHDNSEPAVPVAPKFGQQGA